MYDPFDDYYARGEARGKSEEKFAIVKRMLELGKNSLDDIAKIADLPLSTVQQIQAEMHTA